MRRDEPDIRSLFRPRTIGFGEGLDIVEIKEGDAHFHEHGSMGPQGRAATASLHPGLSAPPYSAFQWEV